MRLLEKMGPPHKGRVRKFRSGVAELDAFLRGPALRNTENRIGTTYLLLRGEEDPEEWPGILGYFTLSMGELPSTVAQRLSSTDLPGFPIPVALIGRLANDARVRGHGVGASLLAEAIRMVRASANVIGCFGVVVDAKDAAAEAFYARYGFVCLDRDDRPSPRRWCLTLSTIEAASEGQDDGDGT